MCILFGLLWLIYSVALFWKLFFFFFHFPKRYFPRNEIFLRRLFFLKIFLFLKQNHHKYHTQKTTPTHLILNHIILHYYTLNSFRLPRETFHHSTSTVRFLRFPSSHIQALTDRLVPVSRAEGTSEGGEALGGLPLCRRVSCGLWMRPLVCLACWFVCVRVCVCVSIYL